MKYNTEIHKLVVEYIRQAYKDAFDESPKWLSDPEIWSIVQEVYWERDVLKVMRTRKGAKNIDTFSG
jgi:hypothetical protein